MAEILDYVDENDNVLGQEEKGKVKERKLNYRIVHIWIFDAEGKLLICQRPSNRKDYAGLWTSTAGGHVQAGESYEKAIRREAFEELGVHLQLKRAFKMDYLHPRGNHVFIDLWTAQLPKEKLHFDTEEIVASQFVSIPDLRKEMQQHPEKFNPQFIQMVEKWDEL